MNRVKYIFIVCFIIVSNALSSQNIQLAELSVFLEIEKGNYNNALDSLDKILETKSDIELYLAKISVLYKTKQYNEALKYCAKADKIKLGVSSELKLKIYLETDDMSNVNLALLYNLKSNYKIPLYQLLNSIDYNKLVGTALIDSVLKTNSYSKSEKQLYQVEKLMNAHDYTEALFLVNEIILRNRNIAYAYYLQCIINKESGDKKRALNAINKAIELKKSRYEYYLSRAKLLKESKEYSIALNDINKAIKLAPFHIENYVQKMDLLFYNENYNQAIELADQILKIASENTGILITKSKSNFKLGNYIDALKAVNESMLIKTSKEQFELRGDIYSATNTFEFAIRDYSMFLDIEPYNGDIYAKKGLARFKSGDKKGACSDWGKGSRYGNYDAVRYLEKYCE